MGFREDLLVGKLKIVLTKQLPRHLQPVPHPTGRLENRVADHIGQSAGRRGPELGVVKVSAVTT